MTFLQILMILRARWRTLVCTFGGVVATAIILTFVIDPRYKAEAFVVSDLKYAGPLDQTPMPGALVANYMGTQIDIITGERVARQVATQLQLDKNEYLRTKWQNSYYYSPDNFQPWVVDWLTKRIDVGPSKTSKGLSNVIDISFTWKDPKFAADVANAFANAYLQANLELHTEPQKTSAVWLDERAKVVRKMLEAAQAKLSAFQQAKGIVASDDRIDVETTRLTALEAQLVAAQGMHSDSSSVQSQSTSGVDDLSQVLQNPLITNLKSQIALDQAQLTHLEKQLGTNHPQYVALQAQIASLNAREAAEVRRIVKSLAATNRVSVRRVSEVERDLAKQKSFVLQLRVQHDQASVLKREVDDAQRTYDLIMQQLAQASLEQQSQQTNVALLSTAVAPFKPAWPKFLLDTALGIVFGGMLGVGHALLRELLDQRVRAPDDIANVVAAPVFVVTFARARLTGRTKRSVLSRARARLAWR